MIQIIFYFICDTIFAILPQPQPDKAKLERVKIVSHRGVHDNKTVFENTLAAFDKAVDTGVWGIELDIRWTKDLQPMVFHDADCKRIFGKKVCLNKFTFAELRKQFPLIPTLSEVVERYGKKLHLMIELKYEVYSNPEQQTAILKQTLSSLTPIQDYHIISLRPVDLFIYTDFVPAQTFLPVMYARAQALSDLALQKSYGGLLGYYALISQARINKHLQAEQVIGLGFIRSKNSLWREINRGAEWIFTNDALKIQSILDEAKKTNPGVDNDNVKL